MTSSKISQRIKPEFIDTSLYHNANQCWDVDKSIGNWKNNNFPLSNAISDRLRDAPVNRHVELTCEGGSTESEELIGEFLQISAMTQNLLVYNYSFEYADEESAS
jgi:hypothetical protein